ncbi:hypothetical protein [Arthrobacter sp. HLT1-21]
MLRSRVAAGAGCALALSLSGCGAAVPETAGTAIELPEIIAETPTAEAADPSPDALPSSAGGDASSLSPSNVSETEDANISTKDCVIVAAGVSSILLAPLSFMGGSDDETVERLHDQIDDVQAMVPKALASDFDRLQDVVTASTEDGGSFDESAFREAVEPIEDWLQQHCNKSLR